MAKIIGHTAHGVLLEAANDEVAHLLGYPFESQARREHPNAYNIGSQIRISELWKILEEERARPQKIAAAAGSLRALADMLLESIDDGTLVNPVKPEKEFR